MQPNEILYFIKLNNRIYRTLQRYLDRLLKKYSLSSGTYPYLLLLKHQDGISQNELSIELGHDKSMTTRSINRLIETGYLSREKDVSNHRANKIFLTDKARSVIPDMLEDIHGFAQTITTDLSDEEKKLTMSALGKILNQLTNSNWSFEKE